jgi:hypothetical protein
MVPLVQILKLPKRGKDQEVFLTVEHCGERLLWKRTFGIQEWNSEQTFEAGVMEERFGSTALRFQVSAVPDQITYRLVGFKLGKTTMPKFLSPRVEAEVTLEGTGWHVSVRTYALIFGLIHEYEAWLTAE